MPLILPVLQEALQAEAVEEFRRRVARMLQNEVTENRDEASTQFKKSIAELRTAVEDAEKVLREAFPDDSGTGTG